jgi:hypothetical protein
MPNYIKVFQEPITQAWTAELRQANHHVLDGRSDYATEGQATLAGQTIWGEELEVVVDTEMEPVRVIVIKEEGGWKKVTNDTVVEQSQHNLPPNESIVEAAQLFPGLPIIMEVPLPPVGIATPSADDPAHEQYGDPVPDRPPVVPED